MGQKIKVNGSEYPCRMTIGAMRRFANETGHDITKMNESSISEQGVLLWCCVKSASNADGVPFAISLEDFLDAIDVDTLLIWANEQAERFGSVTEEEKKIP